MGGPPLHRTAAKGTVPADPGIQGLPDVEHDQRTLQLPPAWRLCRWVWQLSLDVFPARECLASPTLGVED
jgi:hypothetical protein